MRVNARRRRCGEYPALTISVAMHLQKDFKSARRGYCYALLRIGNAQSGHNYRELV